MENLLQSHLLDSGVAYPTGTNYGYVSEREWGMWFPNVKQGQAGVPSENNKDNLSVWSGGRGPFVDAQYHSGEMFDIKMKTRQPSFVDMKQELWAGSPSLEKRENFADQTDEEVVQEFISNQNEKQIVRSCKGLDGKPYLMMFAWQEINLDGTWSWKCVCINATKYFEVKGPSLKAKSGQTCLIYRVKRASQNSEYCDSAASARVEIKFMDGLKWLQDMGVATQVCDPTEVDWKSIL